MKVSPKVKMFFEPHPLEAFGHTIHFQLINEKPIVFFPEQNKKKNIYDRFYLKYSLAHEQERANG